MDDGARQLRGLSAAERGGDDPVLGVPEGDSRGIDGGARRGGEEEREGGAPALEVGVGRREGDGDGDGAAGRQFAFEPGEDVQGRVGG